MNQTRKRIFSILSLLALFALALGLALASLSPIRANAAATYSPSTLFWARTGGEVRAYRLGEADDAERFVAFEFSDGGSVEYHRDLALKWYEKATEEEAQGSALANPGVAKYFSMTFSFPQVNFETYKIAFRSDEENVSKKGQAVNELVFENGQDVVTVHVKDALNAENDDFVPEKKTVNAAGDIEIAFNETDCSIGEFTVTLNGEAVGKFTNVGGYFMEYRTSGTANVPMTFSAELAEGKTSQKVFMKQLNGQTLAVEGGAVATTADADGTYAVDNGRVTDSAPAVLVLNEKVYAFSLGQRFSLSYEAIDVCDDTVEVNRTYYMLAKDADGKFIKPSEDTDDNYKTLTTSTYFMPPDDANDEQTEYVSIRFNLNDGRDGASNDLVYLSWYADLEADVVQTKGNEGEDGFDYILVNRERSAPYYLIVTPDEAKGENTKAATYDEAVSEYQAQLDEIASKTSAGDGAYFYLPSLRGLIASKYADYRNLRFSIYYYKPGQAIGSSASSETGLRYNNLRFEIDAPGTYKLRIFATDASNNVMKMIVDGELADVTGTNIWDVENLPEFTFNVKYTGAVIEDAGEQTTGYRGTPYTVTDFDIIALGDCEKEYSLYYFDEDSAVKAGLGTLTYSTLVSDAKTYLEGDYADYFKEIGVFNADIAEDDPKWSDTDNDYHWDPDSSLSFTPIRSGFYVVKVLLIDPNLANAESTAYQAIQVRNPIDRTPGRIDWFSNNVTSVVLFAISGVLAVAVVVLFVVKPSEKSVEEVDLEKLKGKKKTNK